MTDFKSPKEFLFKEGYEDEHLHTLFTQTGEKNIYDSAAQCNKCAYCSRVCPFQLLTDGENRGPRARNILLRFIMEGKLSLKENRREIKEVLNSCLLCGLCTKECFAKVPTHEHVLELERVLGPRKLPLPAGIIKKFQTLNPFSLKDKINNTRFEGAGGGVVFLPSFEAKYLEVKSGLKVINALNKIFGPVDFLWGGTGVEEYVYGSLPAARKTALKLLEEYKPYDGKKIVTDSLELRNFLKKYPQLFFNTENFDKASAFAKNVYFIADVLPQLAKPEEGAKVLLTKTSAFSAEEKDFASSAALLSKACGAGFCKSWKGEFYPLPLLDYSSIKPAECKIFIKQKISFAARAQGDVLVCASLYQKRLLNKALKNYYPKCKAVYIGDMHGD